MKKASRPERPLLYVMFSISDVYTTSGCVSSNLTFWGIHMATTKGHSHTNGALAAMTGISNSVFLFTGKFLVKFSFEVGKYDFDLYKRIFHGKK
jgi:hypothetical protein